MNHFLLNKEKLVELLSDGRQMTFVSAPAGYGKTTGIRLWLECSDVTPLSLSLSESDNDFTVFRKRLIGALTTHWDQEWTWQPKLAYSETGTQNDLAFKALCLLRQLSEARPDDHYVIVLDDFHLIRDRSVVSAVAEIAGGLTAGIRMLIISRSEPPVQFEPLRIKGMMTLIDDGTLRFSTEDIAALAKMGGRTLTGREAADAYERTCGWPIAVHAYLHGEAQEAADGRELVFRFFEDAVWKGFDCGMKHHILRAGVVDVLTPALFAALTDGRGDEDMLERLCRENAFFSRLQGKTYRFHSLFQEFLLGKLDASGLSRESLYRKAAAWYAESEMPYMAVNYYMLCGDFDSMAPSLYRLFARMEKNGSVEEHYESIRALGLSRFPRETLLKNIFLLETRAWSHYLGGRPDELIRDMDALKEQLGKTSDDVMRCTATLFCTVDHRKKLSAIVDGLYRYRGEFRPAPRAHTASLSQNLPFFHRSYRDHSDYARDTDQKLLKMRATLGRLVGGEYETIENCIKAGVFYEKGMLGKAHACALAAVSAVSPDIPAETAFCAYMILAAVLYAMGKGEEAEKIVVETHSWLLRRECAYLLPNLQAFIIRQKLYEGDTKAAIGWLNRGPVGAANEPLVFFRIYQYFTTAKAYLTVGALDAAIPFLEKLMGFCESYDRPLDVIEARILLSIAMRKKKRPKEADQFLAQAIGSAYEYGFVQPFVLESRDLTAELGRLSYRVTQPGFFADLDGSFVRTIYFAALRAGKKNTEPEDIDAIRFSERQSQLLSFILEGYSYQDIADETGLGISTIKTYLKVVYQKLGVANKKEAAKKAAALHTNFLKSPP